MDPSRTECERQLARILRSEVFNGGTVRGVTFGPPKHSKALLACLAHAALDGRRLTRAEIEREGLELPPRVRRAKTLLATNVHRLTKRLRAYYHHEGLRDRVRITVGHGPEYAARFEYLHHPHRLDPRTPDRAVLAPAEIEFMKGLHHLDRQAPLHLERAIKHFTAAVEQDPTHGRALAGIADAMNAIALHGSGEPPSARLLPEARATAERAVSLEPDSWRVHAVLALMYDWNFEWRPAGAAYQVAVARSSTALVDYEPYFCHVIAVEGVEAGIRVARAYRNLRPADPLAFRCHGMCLYLARQFDEARRVLLEALDMDKHFWLGHITLVLVCLALEQPSDALTHVMEVNDGDPAVWPGMLSLCLARAGRMAEALALVARLEDQQREGYVQSIQLALAYIGVGEHEKAIASLDRSCDERDPVMIWLHLWPFMDPLRSYRSFDALMRRHGFPPRLQ